MTKTGEKHQPPRAPNGFRWWVSFVLAACGSSEQRFGLREPLWQDSDLHRVYVACEARPSEEDPTHRSCAPEPYVSPLAWDGLDNAVFRPLTGVFALDPGVEAVNVNSFDEVPDSAWFTNRLGRASLTREDLLRGACSAEELLEPAATAPQSWLIDQGKLNGASLGFRVRTPDGRKYVFKNDAPGQPERGTAATVIGAAIYHAVGYNTPCEQIVHFDRALLRLQEGLRVTYNTGVTRAFDRAALEQVLSEANRSGDLIRMNSSAWLPGYLIGPFRYEGTRDDDPNDVIPHEDRRDLRGGRVLAAWLNHYDAREQNSMDSWIARDGSQRESSPGFVRHYYLDMSDCFGSEWAWDGISRRLGRSYLLDWGDIGADFVTLGIRTREWERVRRRPGLEMFGYFNGHDFDPEGWKNEYPNPAFSRATERDNAWMARILSRFDRGDIDALVSLGRFSTPAYADYLADVLEQRLQRILERYLLRLSPLADLHVVNGQRLCATDLARRRQLRPEAAFRYRAELEHAGGEGRQPVEVAEGGGLCVRLPRLDVASNAPWDAPERYLIVTLRNAVAQYALRAHLYDLGPERGYRIVGIERPAEP